MAIRGRFQQKVLTALLSLSESLSSRQTRLPHLISAVGTMSFAFLQFKPSDIPLSGVCITLSDVKGSRTLRAPAWEPNGKGQTLMQQATKLLAQADAHHWHVSKMAKDDYTLTILLKHGEQEQSLDVLQ